MQLKRAGRRWPGCARSTPRRRRRSPSTPRRGSTTASAAARGDVITFVREIEHLDFVGAVETLAAKAGIAVRYTEHQ